jgi:HK97 gp10 family phage protein
MSRDVSIAGGKQLQEFLKALPAKVEKNIMRAALRAGARVIANEAKTLVPVGSGKLKKSLRTGSDATKGKVTAYVRAGGRRSGATKDKDAFYAQFIEYGTAAHAIKPKNKKRLKFTAADGTVVITRLVRHTGAKPKPFMRPAFDAKGDAAVRAVSAKIRERLTKAGIEVPANEGTD